MKNTAAALFIFIFLMGPPARAETAMEPRDFVKNISFECIGVNREAGFRVSHRYGEKNDTFTVLFPHIRTDMPLVFRGTRDKLVLKATLDQALTAEAGIASHWLPSDAALTGMHHDDFLQMLARFYVKEDVRYGKELTEGGLSYQEAFIRADSVAFEAYSLEIMKSLKKAREKISPMDKAVPLANAHLMIAGANAARSIDLSCSKAAPHESALVTEHPPLTKATEALFIAINAGSVKDEQDALRNGADVNAVDPDTGNTPLHFAVGDPATLVTLVKQEFLPEAQRQEVKINELNNFAETPMWLAVTAQNVDTVKILREAGGFRKAFYYDEEKQELKPFEIVYVLRMNRIPTDQNPLFKDLTAEQARKMRQEVDRVYGSGTHQLQLEEIANILIEAKGPTHKK